MSRSYEMAIVSSSTKSEAEEESIESLLSVPVDFFLPLENQAQPNPRRPTQQQRFIRKEAWQLLLVRFLASEMDCLLSLSISILMQLSACKQSIHRLLNICGTSCGSEDIMVSLERKKTDPDKQPNSSANEENNEQIHLPPAIPISIALRAVLPLLVIHGENYCNDQLSYIQQQLSTCLTQLQQCSQTILQFSEQNLAVADQLMQVAQNELEDDNEGYSTPISNSGLLAQEKRLVGEIEEAVHTRIEHVLRMAAFCDGAVKQEEQEVDDDGVDAFELAKDEQTGSFVSMEKLCKQLEDEIKSGESRMRPRSPDNGRSDARRSGAVMGLTSLSSLKRHRQEENDLNNQDERDNDVAKRKKVVGGDDEDTVFSKEVEHDFTHSQVNAAAVLAQFSSNT